MNHKAFTMVELLLATSLAVLLMTGTLYVVGSLRAGVSSARPGLREIDARQLIDLIRRDLVHAKSMILGKDRLTLHGYGSLSPIEVERTGRTAISAQYRTHQPVQVDYLIARIGDRNVLQRRQTDLGVLSNRNIWTEWVCVDVESLELYPVDPAIRFPVAFNPSVPGMPPPPQVQLVVYRKDQAEPFVNTLITLR